MSSMWVDLHNHTPYCHHARGSMRESLLRAEQLGISEFGFSEHSPWLMGRESHPMAPDNAEWEEYVQEVQELQAGSRSRKSRMILRLGIEMDYTPNQEQRARDFLPKYPLDYVIGSVHAVFLPEGTSASSEDEHTYLDVRRYYEAYFAQMRLMIATRLVDVIGHLDLPKRDGAVPPQGYLDLVEDLMDLMAETGVAVEINTSGRDKPVQEFFPSPAIIRMLVARGVPITLGSDSHSPLDVARYFHEAESFLREAGAREILCFKGRQKIGKRI